MKKMSENEEGGKCTWRQIQRGKRKWLLNIHFVWKYQKKHMTSVSFWPLSLERSRGSPGEQPEQMAFAAGGGERRTKVLGSAKELSHTAPATCAKMLEIQGIVKGRQGLIRSIQNEIQTKVRYFGTGLAARSISGYVLCDFPAHMQKINHSLVLERTGFSLTGCLNVYITTQSKPVWQYLFFMMPHWHALHINPVFWLKNPFFFLWTDLSSFLICLLPNTPGFQGNVLFRWVIKLNLFSTGPVCSYSSNNWFRKFEVLFSTNFHLPFEQRNVYLIDFMDLIYHLCSVPCFSFTTPFCVLWHSWVLGLLEQSFSLVTHDQMILSSFLTDHESGCNIYSLSSTPSFLFTPNSTYKCTQWILDVGSIFLLLLPIFFRLGGIFARIFFWGKDFLWGFTWVKGL